MQTVAIISEADKAEVKEKLREAAYHLAACWDALREIEQITGREVETDSIQSFAADCDCPATYPELDDEQVQSFLNSLDEGEA